MTIYNIHLSLSHRLKKTFVLFYFTKKFTNKFTNSLKDALVSSRENPFVTEFGFCGNKKIKRCYREWPTGKRLPKTSKLQLQHCLGRKYEKHAAKLLVK